MSVNQVLDQKLDAIAESFELPLQSVCDICLLHRKHKTSNAYWNQLHSQLSTKFYELMER